MTDNQQRTKNLQTAALIALIGNLLLACAKIIAGTRFFSTAMIGDGIDSFSDVLISIVMLAVMKIIVKPADLKHPWGHRRAETVATAFLSFVIFFAGAQLIFNSLKTLSSPQSTVLPSPAAIIVALISIGGKLLLAFSQYYYGKKANSAILLGNAKNMSSDVLISFGVLSGFLLTLITGYASADTVVALLIGCWIIKTALRIFLDANLELMDGNNDLLSYQVIVDAVNAVSEAENPHRARMRKIAGFWDIDLDIDVDPACSVSAAHDIATKVENEIKQRLPDVFDIMIHVEPRGDTTIEAFGLSKNDINSSQ